MPFAVRSRQLVRGMGLAAVLIIATGAVAWAHDMFLRPDRMFVAENARVLVRLLNGTFSQSENSITRDRLADVAIVSTTGRAKLDTAQWTVAGDTSTFTLETGAAGTYVLGTSTNPNIIELTGAEFNEYLESDGIPDELDARRKEGLLESPAKERYHKHVKALLQVGAERSGSYATVLGYPAEIVPMQNPYSAKARDTLRLRLYYRGQPVPNQYVQYGGRTARGARIEQQGTRGDRNGIVRIPLSQAGTWYVKFIHMRRLTDDPEGATHESTWASIAFGVR